MSVDKSDPLEFITYRNDPLAHFFFEKLNWASWRFPAAYTSVSIIFVCAAVLVYLVRDGDLEVGKFGGYHTVIPLLVISLVIYGLGAVFYVYFSLRSGTLFQLLADRSVLDQSNSEIENAITGNANSALVTHNNPWWVFVAIIMSLILLLTILYTWWWDPNRSEMLRYSSTYYFIMLPV